MDPVHRPKVFDLAHSIPQSQDTGLKQFVEAPIKRKHKKMKYHHEDSISNETSNAVESAEDNEAEES